MTAEEIRARILALQADRKPVPLEIEGWGDDVYVRVLSAKDQMDLADDGEAKTMPVRVILACLVTADGEPIFTEDDRDALSSFPFPEIMQVFAKVAGLNGLSNKELEEAVEHFRQAPDEQRSIG